jgi:methylenetetrahydrofolate dehydrogenase (NADP+) / methenyltetrahydrofolate cyclohydrolase
MQIDGKRMAEAVFARLGAQIVRPLSLGILIAGSDTVTDSFVRTKQRAAERLDIALVRKVIPDTATTEDALRALAHLSGQVDGVIVQLPLPQQIDTQAVLTAIPNEKDVDGISSAPRVRPPVAEAVGEIFDACEIDVRGKSAVVVGSGRLVGRPCADLLRELGASITVLSRGDSLEALKDAEILVLGAGEPGLVKPEHLKSGVILIDAGTSESSGKIAGDADPACADVASVFTPVPGGVGPIAVAMIFKNLYTLAGDSR